MEGLAAVFLLNERLRTVVMGQTSEVILILPLVRNIQWRFAGIQTLLILRGADSCAHFLRRYAVAVIVREF